MSILITDVKVILTAPEGINLLVVKVETNQPGLVGLGCATFAYRHLAVKCLIEEYLKPLLVGRDAHAIESLAMLHTSRHDGKEGVASFNEKRAPAYSGRASDGLPDFYPWW